MARYHNLHVYHLALEQIQAIARLDPRFGDLGNQIRRAAISVVSNIAEGAGRGTDAEFVRFLKIARGSNDEVAAQLDIIAALDRHDANASARNQRIGRMLSGLIRSLSTA